MLKPNNVVFKKTQNNKKKKDFSYQRSFDVKCFQKNIFLFSAESGVLTSKLLETGKLIIQKILSKGSTGVVLLSTFPHVPISHKAIGVRMGKGKGPVFFWGAKINSGQVIYEIRGVTDKRVLYRIHKALSYRLPFKLGFRIS